MVWAHGQGSLSSNDHRDKFWGFDWLPHPEANGVDVEARKWGKRNPSHPMVG